MDGFDTHTNVIVIAATNRPDILDPALLRPGRFDRQVVLDRPDMNGRMQILKVHTRGKPSDRTSDLETLAQQTPGFSGADLANLLNEAAIFAARRNKKLIWHGELDEAIDRVVAGPERKSRVISERERRMTAYHEAGHALVARTLPNVDPVHKVSIVARGMMGGYTRSCRRRTATFCTRSSSRPCWPWAIGRARSPKKLRLRRGHDRRRERSRARDEPRPSHGDRVRHERAPRPARLRAEGGAGVPGPGDQRAANYSEQVAEQIDNEIHDIISEAYQRAEQVLRERRAILDTLAQVLMTRETIEGDELLAILEGAPAPGPAEPTPAPAPTV
ncbi:MAG: hypothetical protein KatS3mg060_0866 [Dehalococcoidia bacterium]|nr:MAG: hypothetical protein KatS3mg060_0866 [Dehalococcoidia bacterium]